MSPKVQEKEKAKENGEKTRPQARSFLGALKAVKANQKDMPKIEEKEEEPAADPKSKGDGWTKDWGNRWGRYGSGKSYGKAWSQYQETPKVESKEQTQGMRAWSDDDEPPFRDRKAAKKGDAQGEEKADTKTEDKENWEKKGGSWSGWKKSDGWSNWQSGGWKSSWSKNSWNSGRNWSKDGDKKWSGKTSGMEGSVEEAEERRRKRLERFNAETSVQNSDKVCHINWSTEVEKEKPEAETNTDGNDAAEPAEAKKDSDDERAKQIRTGERARSEDHEED